MLDETIFTHRYYDYEDMITDLGGGFFVLYLIIYLPYRYFVGLNYMSNLVSHIKKLYGLDAKDLQNFRDILKEACDEQKEGGTVEFEGGSKSIDNTATFEDPEPLISK